MKLKEGQVQDVDYVDMLPGSWRRARNVVYYDKHEAIATEPGNESMFNGLPNDHVVIGMHPIKYDQFVVFSCTKYVNNSFFTDTSQIGIVDINGNYTTIINEPLLDFHPNRHISSEIKYRSNGDLICVFTDYRNPPRIMNLTNPSVELDGGFALIDDDEINDLNIFPDIDVPIFSSIRVNESGGVLETGVYSFFIAYETPNGGVTNFSHISDWANVTQDLMSQGYDEYDGEVAGTATSKSVSLNISNIDTRFTQIYVYVAKKIGGIVSMAKFLEAPVSDDTVTITYTGTETEVTVNEQDVLVRRITYNKIKDFTQLDGYLYGLNVSSEPQLDFQRYALDIAVQWVSSEDILLNKIKGSHKDPILLFDTNTFIPGEVYAFYAVPILKDNTFDRASHIPGRDALTINESWIGVGVEAENTLVSTLVTAYPAETHLLNDEAVGDNVKFFHTRDTSRDDGTMGYWENETEVYPNDENYLSADSRDLRGQPVLHHKFPTVEALRDYGTNLFSGGETTLLYERYSYGTSIFQFKKNPYPLADGTINTAGTEYTYTAAPTIEIEVSFEITLILNTDPDEVGAAEIEIYSNSIYQGGGLATGKSSSGDVELTITGTVYISSVSTSHPIEIQFNPNGETFLISSDSWWKIRKVDTTTATADDEMKLPALGVKFSNIVIPNAIASKMQGIMFCYAKRSGKNMTVLGQTMTFFGSEYALDTDKKGTNGANFNVYKGATGTGTTDIHKDIVRFHDFGMMRNKVGPATYMRNEVIFQKSPDITDTITSSTENHMVATIDNITSTVTEVTVVDGDIIRPLINPEYIEANVQVDDDYYNLFAESCLKAEVFTADIPLTIGINGIDPDNATPVGLHNGYLTSIMSHRTDIYSSFQKQQSLILMSSAVVQVSGGGTYSSGNIYSGDGHVCAYNIRCTAPFSYTGPVVSEGGDKAKGLKFSHKFPSYNALNINYRHGIDSVTGEHYWPGVSEEGTTEVDWKGRDWDFDNDYNYNDDYSSVNDLNVILPFSPYQVNTSGEHPNRIIRFQKHDPEEDRESWQIHLPFDYIEILHHRGAIWRGEAFSNRLIINLEQATAVSIGTDRLEANVTEIYLGIGDIFQDDPAELLKSHEGYMGCQSQLGGVLTKSGYFFADQNHGKIFRVGERVDEVSNIGLRNFFRDNLPCQLNIQLTRLLGYNVQYDAPANPWSAGVQMSFDEKYNRVIISKRDFIIADENNFQGEHSFANDYYEDQIVMYEGELFYFNTVSTDAYFIHENPGYPGGELVNFLYAHYLLEKSGLTTDKSFTKSFSLAIDKWVGDHDYLPHYMAHNRNIFVTTQDNVLYKHNVTNVANFYETIYESYIEPMFALKGPHYAQAFYWDTTSELVDDVNWDETFNKAIIYNRNQCSLLTTISKVSNLFPNGNAKYIDNRWQFNDFYDAVTDSNSPFFTDGALNANVAAKSFSKQKRFIGTHVGIRLISDNIAQRHIYLYDIEAIVRPAIR